MVNFAKMSGKSFGNKIQIIRWWLAKVANSANLHEFVSLGKISNFSGFSNPSDPKMKNAEVRIIEARLLNWSS